MPSRPRRPEPAPTSHSSPTSSSRPFPMLFRAARFSGHPYGHVSAIGSITLGTDEPVPVAGSAIERQVSGNPRRQIPVIIDILRRGAEMQREHAGAADTEEQFGWYRRIT